MCSFSAWQPRLIAWAWWLCTGAALSPDKVVDEAIITVDSDRRTLREGYCWSLHPAVYNGRACALKVRHRAFPRVSARGGARLNRA
jgi:hypothetical protein